MQMQFEMSMSPWLSRWALCLCRFVLVIVLSGAPLVPAAAEQWPTTEFEVFPGPPSALSWGDAEEAAYLDLVWSVFQPQEIKLAGEIEDALSTAARKFEAMGFSPPVLKPIVTRDDGSKAYRVYVCKQSWLKKLEDSLNEAGSYKVPLSRLPTLRTIWDACGAIAAHVGDCGEARGFSNYLYFNSDKIFDAPYLRGVDFATITHELFHSVHANTASGRGSKACQAGAWISEGLADAVSIDLARQLWPGISYEKLGEYQNLGKPKEYGIRAYWRPLTARFEGKGQNHTEQYFTSSFWRFVGEWYYAAVADGGRRVGSSQTQSDYRFLIRFLDRPIEGAGDRDGELRWLDEGLRGTPKLATNLARMYSEFIASFADVLRTRIAPGYGGTPPKKLPQSRLDNFFKPVFNDCREVSLSPSAPVAVEKLLLASVSAACIRLTVKGAHGTAAPEHVAVEISAGPQPRTKLTPIWIGKSGGMEVSQLMVFSSKERNDAPAYGTASLKVVVGEPTVFVISNVAEYAQETELLSPMLTFMLSGWDSSMTKAPPDQAVPVKRKARPDDARGNHEAALDEEFAEGLGKLTSNGQFSAEMNVLGESRDCRGKERQYNLCGPQLEIELELRPAAESSVATSTTGGFLNQAQAGGAGQFMDMNLSELDAAFEARDRLKPSNIEGGRIKIYLPSIEYGFTGAFDNALIEVSRDGGGSYKARTQTAVVIDSSAPGQPTLRRVPNGKVTIHQYTPLVLHGEFEASLLDRDSSRPYYPPDEAIPVAAQVTGHFVVSNPFNDGEYAPDEDEFKQQMGLDILEQASASEVAPEMMGPEVIKELCDLGFDNDMFEGLGIEGQCAPGNGSPGENALAGVQCDCSCAENASPKREQCLPVCEADYAMCRSEDNDPEMARLRQLLEVSDFPPVMREQYISDFRTMNSTDRQALLNMLELVADQ